MIEKLKLIFITGFGTGYTPKGSGTVASLIGIIFFVLFSKYIVVYYLLLLFIIVGGIYFSSWGEIYFNEKDSGKIVIDEIAGMMISLAGFTFYKFEAVNIFLIVTAFILFRLFDIFKPFPINNVQKLKGGWGIMLDDIIAGIFSNILLHLILKVKIFLDF